MKPDITNLLQQCDSLKDIIETTDRYFDLNKKLGTVSKSIVVSNIKNVIKICNIKAR